MQRILRIDVCNYNNEALCNLYDSMTDVSGGAVDVFITKERNGWKELSFTIPSVVNTEEGIEDNYRLDYLIADYRLRAELENETDWFLLSEPKIEHDKRKKNVSVTADHISRLLKTKQMNLEFSATEGNNVGTCAALLDVILDGTGWKPGNVATFFEDDGVTEKVRTLNESAGVGAFRMISDLCDKFEAKPIYHGDRTVDILPMNPFSVELIPIDGGFGYGKTIRLEDGQIPTLNGENVLELHYSKELKGIQRTLNTENLVTRLYAYGAYGDNVSGICDLKEVFHDEYIYTLTSEKEKEYQIKDKDSALRYFTVDENISKAKLIYSRLDYASRGYIWNETTGRAYRVYEKPKGEYTKLDYDSIESVQNYVDYLLDFHYYDEVGLLTDEMLQELAKFQREAPKLNEKAVTAATNFNEDEEALSNIGQSNSGFLRLKPKSYGRSSDGKLIIEIDTSENDGIIYRSDYDERNPFTWHTAKGIKDNGDPTSGSPSMVWILHKTNPITFEQAYLKQIDDRMETVTDYYGVQKQQTADYTYGISEKRPEKISLWLDYSDVSGRCTSASLKTDEIYLFCTNSMSGSLGAAFSSDEAAKSSLETELKTVTLKHPVYFEDERTSSGIKASPVSSLGAITGNPDGYGWAYLYNPTKRSWTEGEEAVINDQIELGRLFFCWHKNEDLGWYRAFCQDYEPDASQGRYFYHTKKAVLYMSDGQKWELLDPLTSNENKRIAEAFGIAWKYCLRRDEIYKGKHEYYTWTNDLGKALTPGNYAMVNPFGFYWIFTTDQDIPENKKIKVEVAQNHVWQDEDSSHIVETQATQLSVIDFPTENILSTPLFSTGKINDDTGADENEVGDAWVRTTSIRVHDNTIYETNLPDGSYCVLYDLNNNYVSSQKPEDDKTVSLGNQVGYMRVVCPASVLNNGVLKTDYYVRVQDYENVLFVNDIRYRILSPVKCQGTNKGINNLITLFPEYANKAYQTDLSALQKAQNDIKDLEDEFAEVMQDLLKETRWQDTDYVDQDEDKLYEDALDNLHQIAKPEANYEIDFLDLFGSDPLVENDEVEWPDIDITDAIHMIDPEIDINLWAYIDKLRKCFDKPWATTLEINTRLSLIGQHTFTDIMTKIAEVAKEAKGKQTIYRRAAALSATGQLMAERLEGQIKANQTLISGEAGGWYTNEKGQMVFESESGLYSMMLSGAGLMVANSKNAEGEWNYRSAITGAGLTADLILFGEMSGQRLIAGSITADKLMSGVGNELEIGSNRALTLYATKDGYRPAGSLDTQGSIVPKAKSDESFIQILPGRMDGDENSLPASIYIMSGGLLHMEGSDVELKAHSTMRMESGSGMDIAAGGSFSIAVGDYIDPATGKVTKGKFTVDSENFKINDDGDVEITGTISAYAGNLAGFKILNKEDNGQTIGTAMFVENGVDSLTAEGNGVYLGTDGLNVGGNFVVSKDGATMKFDGSAIGINAITGDITIKSNSKITVNSQKNLSLLTEGSVLLGNEKKPFTISAESTRSYMYSGPSKISDSTTKGVYIGTDGIRINGSKGYLMFSSDDTEPELKISASKITLGSSTLDTTLSNVNTELGKRAVTFRCASTAIISQPYKVGDIWVNTDNSYEWEYICTKVSQTKTADDFVLIGTRKVKGSYFDMDANTGAINITAASTITMTAGATINIAADRALTLTTNGTVEIGNGSNPFIFASVKNTRAYMYNKNGPSSLSSATAGIYVGTDGIRINGSSNSIIANAGGTVSMTGTINATGGNVGGWSITNNGGISKSYKINDVATSMILGNASYVIYTPNFYVTNEGKAYFKGDITGASGTFSGTVSGATISGSTISGSTFKINSSVVYYSDHTRYGGDDNIWLSGHSFQFGKIEVRDPNYNTGTGQSTWSAYSRMKFDDTGSIHLFSYTGYQYGLIDYKLLDTGKGYTCALSSPLGIAIYPDNGVHIGIVREKHDGYATDQRGITLTLDGKAYIRQLILWNPALNNGDGGWQTMDNLF